jgi:hypothetical protein
MFGLLLTSWRWPITVPIVTAVPLIQWCYEFNEEFHFHFRLLSYLFMKNAAARCAGAAVMLINSC